MTTKPIIDRNKSRVMDVLVRVEHASGNLAARWTILMNCRMQHERGDYHEN